MTLLYDASSNRLRNPRFFEGTPDFKPPASLCLRQVRSTPSDRRKTRKASKKGHPSRARRTRVDASIPSGIPSGRMRRERGGEDRLAGNAPFDPGSRAFRKNAGKARTNREAFFSTPWRQERNRQRRKRAPNSTKAIMRLLAFEEPHDRKGLADTCRISPAMRRPSAPRPTGCVCSNPDRHPRPRDPRYPLRARRPCRYRPNRRCRKGCRCTACPRRSKC